MDLSIDISDLIDDLASDWFNKRKKGTYVPYLLADESEDMPNDWDDFSYASVEEVLDFSDAVVTPKLVAQYEVSKKHVVLLTGNLLKTADRYVKAHPRTTSHFSIELETIFKSMEQKELIAALASIKMRGLLLQKAREVLKKEGLTFSDDEIRAMKRKLANKEGDSKQKKGFRPADLLIILVVLLILFAIFFN